MFKAKRQAMTILWLEYLLRTGYQEQLFFGKSWSELSILSGERKALSEEAFNNWSSYWCDWSNRNLAQWEILLCKH